MNSFISCRRKQHSSDPHSSPERHSMILLASKLNELERAIERLQKISAHDALLMLRSSLSAPKLLYVLQTSPCSDNSILASFDATLRDGLSKIINVELSDLQWIQASLPVRDGGLGIRSVSTLAPSAFLASAAGTYELQCSILHRSSTSSTDFQLHSESSVDDALAIWRARSDTEPPVGDEACKQRAWDNASIQVGKDILMANSNDDYNKARLLAVTAPHSGDWLLALPISSCGLRLDDEAVRVSVGLRLGCKIGEPHECVCGSLVDTMGSHALSCKHGSGRLARHHSDTPCIDPC